ncbi:transcriptional regulator [Moorella sp. Hama-1]|uniref:nickel-dependent lactate racemase n=3 Tax=Moorella sp. Hama-1 TaxID=2138101 RepID=UPI0020481112|nr:nickel-dependent lactate racemase [Moorella sp. Hama-1]BCV19951.1 transcriptional regulator [Moorella sp. Hama-1]
MLTTTTCPLYYGKARISVEVPTANLIGIIDPREAKIQEDEFTILRQALQNPIALPPLKELAQPGQKVAIVVDDNTRPTPTWKMLPLILAELETAGVQKEDITIVFANGSHRLQTREEQARLVGEEVMANYRVTDHNPHDKSTLTYLGQTSRGTPVHINHYVAEADLRILTGLIKPHCEAGYSGGGKAILPGVSSIETIISDHNYEANANPNAVFGVIDGNPIRSDIEDAAHLVEPCFILNVILDKEKRIVDAVAGEMIKAHRVGTQKLDRLVRVAVPEVADIVIAGCSYPTSVSLYQAANAALACTRLVHPIVKKGGIIILAAPCPEGVGGGPLYQLMSEAATPQEVVDKIAQPGFFLHDQWAAQLWATSLIHSDVYLVAEGITPEQARNMKAALYTSVEAALKAALTAKGRQGHILVLPDAPYTIPELTV